MLNVTADQINLSNIPKFQAKLQAVIDDFDLIMAADGSDQAKTERVAMLLNGMGK